MNAPPSTRPGADDTRPAGDGGRAEALLPFPIELLTPTHYARLGLAEDADAAAVEAAWQRLAPPGARAGGSTPAWDDSVRAAWPAAGGLESAEVRARQRALAYAVLRDPLRRRVYDRWLAEHRDRITLAPPASRWQALLHSARLHRRAKLVIGVLALLAAAALVWA